ncbi:uncharacterized protein FOMMEDRAFT_77585 [Fomitiporia mediterranea MF3/22]|uniref:uncharacterized protein n=1 Tax=Fomitiporia mediterranea (strain MF3/22) TaxID=694068 RepID=UPI0004409171|nr:uncharacterized protein FOMMEDRAFT_77585 [Fomitiporia mediterranea MF3/22]EJD05770.1 hypothetical protein FOMMEDRAFT_77585 [Fomitiporia mediterranea MF3/22]
MINEPKSEPAVDEKETQNEAVSAAEGGNDSDVCWICAEPVKFYSLSECNHRTCHVCALRLRALYKKMDCTFCKHPQAMVIFTSSPDSHFEDYNPDEMTFKDPKLAVVFETRDMMEETLILLRFNCPDEECPFIGKGWNDLKVHVRATHNKQLCDICIRHKKVFSHEHTLYTLAQLQVHVPSMPQRGKGAGKDKENPVGGIHPFCEFCRGCFFGDDELFSHMRERHEECFVCKRGGVRDQYFLDYSNLEQHFNTAHYACNQPACQARKFVVFGSLMDLKAHMVEEHGSSMSTRDMKEARRLETNFEFDDHRGTNGRRRERDRERPGGLPTPPRDSTPPPRPPDRRREGFGASLTGQNVSGSGIPSLRNDSFPSLPTEDVDPETASRHAAFMARVASVTSNSSSAEASVRSAIRSYRASESAARDLITTFYNIVDRDLEATASLIVPLLDLLDDEEKKRELLQSFNGFKIEQRQQFPDLVAGGQGAAYAGVASGRVLNVKHSTQARGNAGRIWDRVARAATSLSAVPGAAGPSSRPADRFPALPAVVPGPATSTPAFRQPQRSTPWSSSSSSAAVASPPASSNRVFSEKVNKVTPGASANLSSAAFPSLPTAPPRNKLPMSGNKSLRNIIGSAAPSANAWTASADDPAGAPATEGNSEEATVNVSSQQKRGKKKGKEKVTLFTLGTFPT